MKKSIKLLTILLIVLSSLDNFRGARGEESRAAWWLQVDGVEPVADLQNIARPGEEAKFKDRLGKFTAAQRGDSLVIEGHFLPNIWRFDYTTFEGQFDMKRLYVTPSGVTNPNPESLWSAEFRRRFGQDYGGATGPWEIYGNFWLVPTARVGLDGNHVYTNWFDLPSLEDQKAGRVYASFGLDIRDSGMHQVSIAFAPFTYNTRAARADRPTDAKVETRPNPLKPDQIASIAIGVDERTRTLRRILLKPDLAGKHPRLSGTVAASAEGGPLTAENPVVQAFEVDLDPDRGENWEYSISEESMASDNDMDLGKKLGGAAARYDQIWPRLDPEARKVVDEMFIKRANGFYTFCVFQRNYHPTGYAQNHASCAQAGLLLAGLAFDGPIAEKWLDWAVALYSKRVELLGQDGSVEFMNEGRSYGLGFWQNGVDALKRVTGIDLAQGPFFLNEWRFALHRSPSFADYVYAKFPVTIPGEVKPESLPADWLFEDAGQVTMRSHWRENSYRARLWSGPPFGRRGTDLAKRYNFAHYQINQGSFTLAKGKYELIPEPSATREYRRSAAGSNSILVNRTDQWGGGQVWHPKLSSSQYGKVPMFADGGLMSLARAELTGAYPPAARVRSLSRVVAHLKPDHFLVFDRVDTEGAGEAEWRFHAGVIEPSITPGRYTCFGSSFNPQGKSPLESFVKIPEASVEVAFLFPQAVPTTLGLTEMFFRWRPDRPTQHMKVRQSSEDGRLELLTVFGPDVDFKPVEGGRGFQRAHGSILWTVLLGPGRCGPLKSDGFFAVAAEETNNRQVNGARWGGRSLAYGAVEVGGESEDLFAVIEGEKVVATSTTR